MKARGNASEDEEEAREAEEAARRAKHEEQAANDLAARRFAAAGPPIFAQVLHPADVSFLSFFPRYWSLIIIFWNLDTSNQLLNHCCVTPIFAQVFYSADVRFLLSYSLFLFSGHLYPCYQGLLRLETQVMHRVMTAVWWQYAFHYLTVIKTSFAEFLPQPCIVAELDVEALDAFFPLLPSTS